MDTLGMYWDNGQMETTSWDLGFRVYSFSIFGISGFGCMVRDLGFRLSTAGSPQ